MEKELRTCPGCGASTPDPCPYCGWAPDRSKLSHIAAPMETPAQSEAPSPSTDAVEEVPLITEETEPGDAILEGQEVPRTAEAPPDHFRDLLKPGQEPIHLLEQVPEEMRAILAGRLKAAEEVDSPSFSENAASSLRGQGYLISQDARGARFAAAPGQSADLSASDVVKMAADMDGGIQPRTNLPICSKCQSASPIGEKQCQWCGEPLDRGK